VSVEVFYLLEGEWLEDVNHGEESDSFFHGFSPSS
jgi:hypothetical protein